MENNWNVKNSLLKLELNEESGYKYTSTEMISANQWRDINLVIEGKLKSTDTIENEAESKP